MEKINRQSTINLNRQQLELAITKIDRRLLELHQFDVKGIKKVPSSKLQSIAHKLDDLLIEIFGRNTEEYKRYSYITHFSGTSFNLYSHTIDQFRIWIKAELESAISALETIKSCFEEKLKDIPSEELPKLRDYRGLKLHPVIDDAATKLYDDGYYSNAVEQAVKGLEKYVSKKSGREDLSGKSLMEHAFSINNPLLKFNSLKTRSEKDEQLGYMSLFSGAVLGLRNPRAHEFLKDEPDLALEFIAFTNLLATLLDKVEKC